MNSDELRAYVERSRDLVESSPGLSERNTQLRLVQPLLTALGWELHQVAADYRLDAGDRQVAVDFALLCDGAPAVVIETTACADDLERDQAARLGRILLDGGVDRGLLTNGREFVFVAATRNGLERFECRLADLTDNHDAVAEYSRRATERRRDEVAKRRRDAAAALADVREDVVEDLTDRLVETTGDAVAESVREETGRFVDALIESFGGAAETSAVEGDPESAAGSAPGTDTDSAPDENTRESEQERNGDASDDREHVDEVSVRQERDVPDDALGGAVAADGQQYVVRFFGGRSSVWAVGHARAAMTTAQAIEYLLQRGSLETSLATPWGPDDEHALLRDERIPNASIELSNGMHLDAGVPVGVAREAIETLADQAGLRAMFQDAWSDES
jgi:hypothetical protein